MDTLRAQPDLPLTYRFPPHLTEETEVSMSATYLADGLVFGMQRGPFQNNGATPWYSPLALGTPGQPLKLAIDTGTNITWTTSTLCPTEQCLHSGGGRFDYQASSTFAFTDSLQRPYSFGPWGTMQVEAGTDMLALPQGEAISINLFLAANYSGDQFRQLDWDGGIGLPSSSAYSEQRSSILFLELIQRGHIDPQQPYVCFDWDPITQLGTCQMGGIDQRKTQGPHLFLPWAAYNKIPGVEYIWATDLSTYTVGGKTLATHIRFALDSGSSRFKGDDALIKQTLNRIAQGDNPDVVLGFTGGEITLGADLYNVLIEEGPEKGQVLPQFAALGLTDLVLVGSLVMEHCYTVHEYQVVQNSPGAYALEPVGIWLFNRPDGPQIITRSSSQNFRPAHSASVAGTWKNDYGSVMTLSVSGNQVSGLYQSSIGSTGTYEVVGYQLITPPTPTRGQPVALAIAWHSIVEGPADPSWHWSSGLCGQLSLIDGEEVLTLSHLLVASCDFTGVTPQGNHIDTLVYRRAAEPVQRPEQNTASSQQPVTKNPLTGIWSGSDGTVLKVSVEAVKKGRLGRVCGYLTSATGHTEVCGFSDNNATTSGLSLQSLTLTAVAQSRVLSLCGVLNMKHDVLELLIMTSVPTAPAQRYVQTQISPVTYSRKSRY